MLISFKTSSSLMITSYALISITNLLLVSQHIFSTESSIKESTELGLFVAAVAISAINCMLLLYIKSRKMPKQGIPYGIMSLRTFNFGPLVFTILQIILMAILIALFILSYTTISSTTKVFILTALIILNLGQVLSVWSFNSTYCGTFQARQSMGMGMGMGMGNSMMGSMGMQNPMMGQMGMQNDPTQMMGIP